MAERWWRWGWPVTLLVLAAAVPLLVWVGWAAISDSSDGTEVESRLDPSAPGYQAFVDPTPVLLLIHQAAEGNLAGVTLLALTNAEAGGAVLFLAPETMTSTGPLSGRWAEAGRAGVADGLAEVLGIRPSETQVVDDQGWTGLVVAVAPVVFDNPDPLVAPDGEVRFDTGELSLRAADVGPFLGWRNWGESPGAALFRHKLFWGAWLDLVARSSNPDVIPGETNQGVGRFGRSLAAGSVRMEAAPGVVGPSGAVALDPIATAELVNEVIPFPLPATDGSLPRVRLLDGVGDSALSQAAARVLSRAGAQITLIGNASEFGWETTKIVYGDIELAPHAEAYRDALGTGSTVFEEQADPSIDITVTFGADFSRQPSAGG